MLARRSQRPGCDIAVSGSGWPTVLGRLVEQHNLASAARRRPLVSQRRHAPLLLAGCCWLAAAGSRDRSRPDRPQRASQARKRPSVCRALARGGAVAKPLLLSLPSRPSGTYHAAPKLAHAMVRGRSWSKERGVTACGCVSEVCLLSLEQSSASVSAVVLPAHPRWRSSPAWMFLSLHRTLAL